MFRLERKKPLTTRGRRRHQGQRRLGIELDDNLIENERNAPEWEYPVRSDRFDGSVIDH